ncbi:Shikimate dehydrogenase (NADP(+)) [Gammaproteobacteria bacterium]
MLVLCLQILTRFAKENGMDQYAVMGNPVAHSKSPLIHTLFAEETGQSFTYTAIQVELGHFPETVNSFFASGGKGLNVTVPFKTETYALATIRSARATRAGAVNTLDLRKEGLFGDNTDGIGLLRDLTQNIGISLKGIRILVLGAGGAARGILQPILEQKPSIVFIANRTPERAYQLTSTFSDLGKIEGSALNTLAGKHFDLILNATRASLEGDGLLLPDGLLERGGGGYDLMYGKDTPFLSWARKQGAGWVSDGLGMLVEQAAEAFFIWRGVHPSTAPVLEKIRESKQL